MKYNLKMGFPFSKTKCRMVLVTYVGRTNLYNSYLYNFVPEIMINLSQSEGWILKIINQSEGWIILSQNPHITSTNVTLGRYKNTVQLNHTLRMIQLYCIFISA